MTARAAGADPLDTAALAEAFDALPMPAALLDARGAITRTNAAWRDAGGRLLPGRALGPGDVFLEQCRGAAALFDGAASRAGTGVEEIVAGRQSAFALDYWQTTPPRQSFRLSAYALGHGAGTLLLHTDITSSESADARARRLAHALGERVKEQRALFETVRVLRDDSPAASALAQVVELLPPAMQFPEITEARVALGPVEARTPAFAETPWMLRRTFTTGDGVAGIIEIVYREEPAANAEGPFLPEERHLVDSLAALLGTFAERRANRDRLDRALNLLEGLVQSLDAVLYEADAETLQFRFVSRQAERLLGYPIAAWLEDPSFWPAHIHPEDREEAVRVCREQTALGHNHAFEYRFLAADGRVLWLRDIVTVVTADEGPALLRGMLLDVTAQKNAERERHESEERFRQLAERIEEVFWLTDVGKQAILYVSPAYEKIWGRSCASLYANPRQWLDAIHEDDRARVAAGLAKQAEGHYAEEYRIIRPDGATRWISDRAFPISDASGAVYRVAGVAADITERRETESQMMRAQRLDTIGTLAGGISHDLNNVLAPIMMSIELLRDDLTSPAQRDLLDTLHASARRGADLIQQLLAFARGRDGRREPVDLPQIASDVQRIVRETFPKDIRITLAFERGVPAVLGDATQLYQVLMNLVLNARDAMPTGGDLHIDIASRARAASADGAPARDVILRIADTGHGITPSEQERIFDPFYTTKEIGQGTGLGLATVAAIVRTHGGSIDVESVPGHGARFTICLPAAGDPAAPVGPDALGPRPRGSGERVLVIDDDDGVRRLCTTVLERHGYRVVAAVNGAEGVDRFTEAPDSFALVITDMDMPVMDGPATIAALKTIRPGVRILGSTGHTGRHQARAWLADGVPVLSKPYTAGRLLTLVASTLR